MCSEITDIEPKAKCLCNGYIYADLLDFDFDTYIDGPITYSSLSSPCTKAGLELVPIRDPVFLSTGEIAGIAFGIILVVLIAGYFVFRYRRKKRKRVQHKEQGASK